MLGINRWLVLRAGFCSLVIFRNLGKFGLHVAAFTVDSMDSMRTPWKPMGDCQIQPSSDTETDFLDLMARIAFCNGKGNREGHLIHI